MSPQGEITARRICPPGIADARCYRGKCISCNAFDYVPLAEVEERAVAEGYGRDFIAGRTIDFLHANVLREV
jgi:hypothetical protein